MKTASILITCLLMAVSLFSQDAESLMKEGIAFHDKGEFDKAIEKYKEALVLAPNSWHLHYELAFSYHAKKDYENALLSANEAITLTEGKNRLYPIIIKGSVLDDMGNTEESVKFYKQALKDFPDEYLLLYNYAVSCSRLSDYAEAEQSLLRGLKINPTHPGSHLQLALIKLDRNEKVNAALGLYYFLMLESNSPRAKEQTTRLKNLIYGSQSDGEKKNIVITLPDTKSDTRATSAELFFSMLGLTSNEIDKTVKEEGKQRSEQQKFVDDTKKLFKTLSELSASEKSKSGKKKKAKTSQENFWWDFYVPFFSSLQEADHTEAFCYHIMQSSDNPEITDWLNQNKEKREFFYLWVSGK